MLVCPKRSLLKNWKGQDERGRPRKGWREEVVRDLQVMGVRRWRELVKGKNGDVLVDRPKPIVGCSGRRRRRRRMVLLIICDKSQRNAGNNGGRFYYTVQGGSCRSLRKSASLPVNIFQLKHVWGLFLQIAVHVVHAYHTSIPTVDDDDKQIRRMTNRSGAVVESCGR
jgi:hypothetical protein